MGKSQANVPVKRTNRLPRTNASSKVGKGRHRGDSDNASHRRSAETIQRLKMYTNGKPIRNKEGRVVAGTFMMGTRAGDREIDASTGRIQPDRRWFGNTRVVSAKELDKFREEMSEKISDPYSVVLKRKKLPMGLLQDAADYVHNKNNKNNKNTNTALLEQEPYSEVFGSKSRRKRVKLDQLLIARGQQQQQEDEDEEEEETNDNEDEEKKDGDAYSALLATAKKSYEKYEEINTREGIVPWGRDVNIERSSGLGVDWRHEKKDDLFLKGQSKRIWGEFYKVIDCSDIVLHVIDARNVPGTRCTTVEKHLAQNAKHKHLIFVLNKVDLVPNWVVKRWIGELSKDRPTIAFHASLRNAFGKGALISLLRQFSTLYQKDKKQISVGVIGYPNVGKSSIINTLISKKSCKVAPVPGETKIWQYITLFKRISLIDCPGIVVDDTDLEGSETESVLKGVIRAERLESPEDYVDAICERVKKEHIVAQYNLTHLLKKAKRKKKKKHSRGANNKNNKDDKKEEAEEQDDNDDNDENKDDDDEEEEEYDWKDSVELMEMIALKSGRLLKGGEPCLRSAAIMLINDFQRGRLPHYVAPPELKEDEEETTTHNDNDNDNNATKTDKEKNNDDNNDEKEKNDNDSSQPVASSSAADAAVMMMKNVKQNLDSTGEEYMTKDDDDDNDDDDNNSEDENDDEEARITKDASGSSNNNDENKDDGKNSSSRKKSRGERKKEKRARKRKARNENDDEKEQKQEHDLSKDDEKKNAGSESESDNDNTKKTANTLLIGDGDWDD